MAEPAPAPALDAPAGLAPVPVPAPQDAPPAAEPWSPARRVAFRFLFCFAVLLYFPFPLDYIPFAEALTGPIGEAQRKAAIWLTVRLLHPAEDQIPESTGSGDILWDYVHAAAVLVLAAIGAAAWSLLDRRRRQYRTLNAWLTIGLRWLLFFAMIGYGLSKVFPLQMPTDEARLMQPLGSMSPMGLLWTFMGLFPAYEAIAGWGEVIGGLLLLWRRTASIGALLLLAVLGNVVAVNFCYDVPVKLYSSQLWLIAAFIAAPDALRIFRLLVLRRPTEPAPVVPLVPWARFARLKRFRWLGPALALTWAGWTLYSEVKGHLERSKQLDEMRANAPMSGVYQVESFTAPADAGPDSAFAGAAWARVGGSFRRISVLRADGSFVHLRTEKMPDGALKLTPFDSKEPTLVRVEHPDPEHVRLTAEGFEAKLKKLPPSAFLLLRGFHWVQPKPVNR